MWIIEERRHIWSREVLVRRKWSTRGGFSGEVGRSDMDVRRKGLDVVDEVVRLSVPLIDKSIE